MSGCSGGETLRLGAGRELEVLALPGHTLGHLGLWDAETGAAIVIDAVLADGVYDRAGNRLIPPRYYDAGAYEATIRRLRALDPELLLTAHYEVMERAAAREFLDRSLDFVHAVRAAVRATRDDRPARADRGGRRGGRPVPRLHARARRLGARAPDRARVDSPHGRPRAGAARGGRRVAAHLDGRRAHVARVVAHGAGRDRRRARDRALRTGAARHRAVAVRRPRLRATRGWRSRCWCSARSASARSSAPSSRACTSRSRSGSWPASQPAACCSRSSPSCSSARSSSCHRVTERLRSNRQVAPGRSPPAQPLRP